MKLRLLAALVLLSTTGAANAATYVLDTITYANSFTGATVYTVGGNLAGTCYGCGSAIATTDGLGNVDLDSIGWQATPSVNYTVNFAGLTNVGSGDLTKDAGHTCTQVAGTGCTGNLDGYGGAALHRSGADGPRPVRCAS